jgi:hypothetical protein
LLSNFTPISLHMLKCSSAHTLSCLFMYCSFANIGHADVMCSTVSSNCLHSLHLLSVSVSNIFATWYLVCNAWSCAAIISLSISPLKVRYALHSHRNVSSLLTSYLPLLLYTGHTVLWFQSFSLRTSVVVVIIIIILGISCMQDIYTYIPETNHVPREHRVAAILM